MLPAMVAYWNAAERCVFANDAYRVWFGRDPSEMSGMHIADLLGPLYARNLPYIRRALQGETQVFERQILLPGGEFRDSIATYTPDVVDGVVLGFSAHVADVTALRRREAELERTIQETIAILEQTKSSFQSKQLRLLRERLLQISSALPPDQLTRASTADGRVH